MKDKKKLIIIIGIICLIAVIIVFALLKNNAKNKTDTKIRYPKVDFHTLFNLIDINNGSIEVEKNNSIKVAKKYITGKEVYVAKASVELEDKKGTIIYLRDSYNKANIFQAKYRIDEDASISIQVEKYIDAFKDICLPKMVGKVSDEKEIKGMIIGTDEGKSKTLGEKIYVDKELYEFTYDVEEYDGIKEVTKQYEINFYRDGQYLICEFANVLN